MPVQTPQLEEPVFGGGIATQQSAAEATPAGPTGSTPQALPPGAGFVSKKGAGAYVANSIINGWLKGRQEASVHNMQNAQNELGTAKHAYDVIAQNYKNVAEQKGEDSPEAQKARQTAVAVWNQYNQTRAKYAFPEDQGKQGSGKSGGKGKGEQFKGALGHWAGQMFGKSGVQPQMFAEMAIKQAQNNPEGLDLDQQDRLGMEQMKQTKTATELGQEQLADVKAARKLREEKDADDEKVKAIQMKPSLPSAGDPPGTTYRTPAEAQWLDKWEKYQNFVAHVNDPESQKFADSVLKKVEAGTQLSDTERNFAYSQKLLQGPQSIQYQDGLNTYVAMQNPDGTIANRVKLGRVFHEDEAAVAAREQMLKHQLTVGEFKRAGMTDKDAEQAATLEEAKNPALVAQFIGNNPIAEENNKKALNQALRTVWANAGGLNADKATKDNAQAVMSNFISGEPKTAKGYLLFRNQATPTGTTGWWNKQNTYAGGLTQDKLASQQAALWDQVRQTLHEQNPTMTPMDLDAAMPEWLKTPEGQPPAGAQQGGQSGGQATTGAGNQPMAAPPPEGESLLGKVGDVLTFPARTAIKAGGLGIDAAKYLMSKPPAATSEAPQKGKDGYYRTKTKDTREYRVKTADGWVKYHMTDDDAKKAKDNGFEIQPITISSQAAQ